MAAQSENLGTYAAQRLRGTDAAYLQGAVRPMGGLPDPIAMLTGPATIVGPIAGAVSASSFWNVGITGPAWDNVVWVLISAGYTIRRKATGANETIDSSWFHPVGEVADGDKLRAPGCGPGLGLTHAITSSAGTYTNADLPDDPAALRACWYPIDPDLTRAAWTSVITSIVGSGGIAASDIDLDTSQIRFLGFPITAWNSTALWTATSYRGS